MADEVYTADLDVYQRAIDERLGELRAAWWSLLWETDRRIWEDILHAFSLLDRSGLRVHSSGCLELDRLYVYHRVDRFFPDGALSDRARYQVAEAVHGLISARLREGTDSPTRTGDEYHVENLIGPEYLDFIIGFTGGVLSNLAYDVLKNGWRRCSGGSLFKRKQSTSDAAVDPGELLDRLVRVAVIEHCQGSEELKVPELANIKVTTWVPGAKSCVAVVVASNPELSAKVEIPYGGFRERGVVVLTVQQPVDQRPEYPA